MTQIKVLVAEDDTNIRMGLVDTLESEGYGVSQAKDGKMAMQLFDKDCFDLVLLDVMMPEKSGYDVCRDIRATNEDIPIIMLTAKVEEIDKVVGLKLGADDYMTKPFGIHELLARISAVLRRSKREKNKDKAIVDQPFMFGEFEVNPKTYKINKEKASIDISERELKLICHFHVHPGEVLSRDNILNAIWGIDYLGTTRTLDQHIAQLRKKIEMDPSNPMLITTIHGVGYRYEA
ncbi:MAG: response regulator transcription factor [Desulfobacula sp.]|nr:response regulator transcription factor [Desulfobacula sp.]MBT3486223.1 response regulator transcription factor [Desulfobacula sp.]MBT3803583.1 response regulator transcription factor [Desulfobacula sp.]MBT4025721.1 response regulator transcription factor [Desulfobacula sp.]MBT4199191.1 response regulator transcription factor [Desulfobacula sp.]